MNESRRKLSVILDFDETVTMEDIGLHMTRLFSHTPDEIKKADGAYERGEITIEELYSVEVSTLRVEDHEEMRSKVSSLAEIRAGFLELIQFCRDREIPVAIASSGMNRAAGIV